MKSFNSFTYLLIASFVLLIAGCANPADKTEDAKVAEAVDTVRSVVNAKMYTISGDSSISFVGSKVTGSHDGGFKDFSGTIAVANGMIAPSSQIKIQMESLWSDSNRLTGHLKNSDFFDVPNFPTAEFVVTSLSENGELTGNLTIRGVTNNITFPAKIDVSDSSVALKAEFDIKRFDWGIAYKGKVDDLIRDKVVIKLDVTASTDA